jgi:hypothetical protein
MRPGKDGVNRTILMRRRRTKDEVVDRRGLTTVDKNIRLAQDFVVLDILTLNGFPSTEERSRIANEALAQAIAQTGKCMSNFSACSTSGMIWMS